MADKLSSSNSAVSWPVPTRSIYKELRGQHTELIILKQWCVAKNKLAFLSFQNITKVTLTLLQYLNCRGDVQGGGQIWWWLCLQFCHAFLELPQSDVFEKLHMVPPPQIDIRLCFWKIFKDIQVIKSVMKLKLFFLFNLPRNHGTTTDSCKSCLIYVLEPLHLT